jgi:hypothetical protein
VTEQEFLGLPDREKDALVEEHIFSGKVLHLNQKSGWRVDYASDREEGNDPIWTDHGVAACRLKRYSTDIAAAIQVMEKVRKEDKYKVEISSYPDSDVWTIKAFSYPKACSTSQMTIPLAICLAALKAKGVVT